MLNRDRISSALTLDVHGLHSRPDAFVSRRATYAFVTSRTFGCARPGRPQTTCASAFAPTEALGTRPHVVQRMHLLVGGFFSSSMSRSGSGTAVSLASRAVRDGLDARLAGSRRIQVGGASARGSSIRAAKLHVT